MSVFNLIKSRVSIFDVVNEYTTLKKAGNYWKSRCPFHHEKTASFTVSPHKDIFYCFGCHEGGDVIAFIAKMENCGQHEAVQFLADRYNIELPKDTEKYEQTAQEKQQYFDICKEVATWCHTQLTKHPSVLKYLQERLIEGSMLDDFLIGYFPGGLASIKKLLHALKDKNILADDLLETHIISQGKTVLFSPYEDRIIFPIRDHLGRFCGFGGRTFKLTDTRAKYYNSRENDFFQKGSLLFNLDRAKKAIQESGRAFLVEGYTDCIAMAQAGYPNTVATLGTSCTINHLKLLSRYAPYLYVLYDRDAAGEKAILRLTELCWQASMELKVVQLPQGQDPASFLSAGNDLSPRITHAQDIFAFFIEQIGADFSTAPLHERVQKIKRLIDIIALINDPLKQDVLIQTAAQNFSMPFESIKAALRRQKGHNEPEESSPQKPAAIPASEEPGTLEKQIFCAIMNNPEMFDSHNDNYVIDQFDESLRSIIKKLVAEKEQQTSFAFDSFFDTLDDNEKNNVSKLLVTHSEPISMTAYKDLLIQFQKKQWKQIIQSITAQLEKAHTDGDQQTVDRLLHDYRTLKDKMVPAMTGQLSEEGKT